MELVATAFTALTGATAATAATAAPLSLTAGSAGAAATAGAWGAGLASSSWLTALQFGMAGLGALSTLSAGEEKADALNASAADADMQAGNERIVGQERRSSLKRQAADEIAQKQAAYAAGGVDLSFGTPQIAQAQDVRDAEHALAVDQGTEDQRVARLAGRAAELRSAAKSARNASMLSAFIKGGETIHSALRRGVFS